MKRYAAVPLGKEAKQPAAGLLLAKNDLKTVEDTRAAFAANCRAFSSTSTLSVISLFIVTVSYTVIRPDHECSPAHRWRPSSSHLLEGVVLTVADDEKVEQIDPEQASSLPQPGAERDIVR